MWWLYNSLPCTAYTNPSVRRATVEEKRKSSLILKPENLSIYKETHFFAHSLTKRIRLNFAHQLNLVFFYFCSYFKTLNNRSINLYIAAEQLSFTDLPSRKFKNQQIENFNFF